MKYSTEVVLCTYNGVAYIVDQLRSIVNQSVNVNKISIYDDQSTDDTVSAINEYIQSCPDYVRDKFSINVNRKNIGYSLNFVQAIENSTQEILFLCDQDDVWESQKVEVLLKYFYDESLGMVFSDGALINGCGEGYANTSVLESYGLNNSQIKNFRINAFELLIKRNYVNGAAVAIRRSAAIKALPLPCDMPHDFWLAIWCALYGGIQASDQRLYRYRQHSSNVIGIGSDSFIYMVLGIWRHSALPRQREYRIWKAVTKRIEIIGNSNKSTLAKNKLDWLERVVKSEINSNFRFVCIIKSILNGDYKKYSSMQSALRDLISIIR